MSSLEDSRTIIEQKLKEILPTARNEKDSGSDVVTKITPNQVSISLLIISN